AAVQDRDAELEQPDAQPCPALAARIPPGPAIVHEEGLWQSVAPERAIEPALHGRALLVGTGFKAHIVARVVVHDGQRMTPDAIGNRYPTLEVHLPEQVRRRLLEPLS